uniref:(California timema) hypothetical protein n=1 Tax=Timema californicum TaxID=61474 RepID=A0A7R9JHC5_TIMCA|nr:unnamed protein product [Timema californicum]
MGKHKKGRSVKNNKQVQVDEPDNLKLAPHSFVIHRGSVGKYVQELTKDFRKVMEPFTASSLKVRRKNSLKDFVSVSGILHVSHLCTFTHTDISTYMKLANLPRGPTLTFKVHNYSLSRDVASMLKKQMVFDRVFKNSPLIVLNSFSGEGMHLKLMASMFQNMFPTINVTKVMARDPGYRSRGLRFDPQYFKKKNSVKQWIWNKAKLSLARTNEELLEKKSNNSSLEN